MKTREYIFLRPDISKYQVSNFRNQEKSEIEKIANIKYCQSFDEANTEENKNLPILFCSTSYTKIYDYKSLFNRIKLWIHPNSGYDNLDVHFVKENNFPIIIGNEIRADAVFLYIIQCFMNYLGNIPFLNNWDSKREFQRINFYQTRVLIVGHGDIGSKVSNFLNSSHINYDIYDPFLEDPKQATIHQLQLENYDVVILSCSLNKTSKHILNRVNLKNLNKPICIINSARGELIEEDALLEYKNRFPEAKIFLDVFEKEPCDFEKFSRLPNVFTSSHVAGVYNEIDSKIIEFEAKIIESYLNLSFSEFELKYNKYELKKRIKKDLLI